MFSTFTAFSPPLRHLILYFSQQSIIPTPYNSGSWLEGTMITLPLCKCITLDLPLDFIAMLRVVLKVGSQGLAFIISQDKE